MKKRTLLGVALLCLLPGLSCSADVVAVVSAKKHACRLSREQIADLFLGKRARFPDGAIAVPIDQPDGSPQRREFYAKFAGRSESQIRAYWAGMLFTGRGHPPREALDGEEVKNMLVENPDAIGYIERDKVDERVSICSGRK